MEEISTEIGDLHIKTGLSGKTYLVRFNESILCATRTLGDWHVCLSKFLFKLDGIDFMRLFDFFVEILQRLVVGTGGVYTTSSS